MPSATQRMISRTIHIVIGVALVAYVYVPAGGFSDALRTGLMWGGAPIVALSGTWLWKGAALRRLIRDRQVAT